MHNGYEDRAAELDSAAFGERERLGRRDVIHDQRRSVAWNNYYAVALSFEMEVSGGHAVARDLHVGGRVGADNDGSLLAGREFKEPRALIHAEL